MANLYHFQGMMAPVFTPMKPDGDLNLEVIPSYAEYLSSNGVKGVYVAGTSGEGLSLTVPERKLLTEAWVKCSAKYQLEIMSMVGAAALRDTQELATHAEKVGVGAIATLPSLFFKPETVDELIDYCCEIASAAPSTPLFYYHIPFLTGVNLSMEEFFKRGGAKIKTLCGMKFTSMEVATEGAKCLKIESGKFNILPGFDQTLAEALFLGCEGAINGCFNFLGREAIVIFDYAKKAQNSSESERKKLSLMAQNQQQKINSYFEVMFHPKGFSIARLKAAMTILTGIDVGPPRKPLNQVSHEENASLKLGLSRLASGLKD